MVLSISWRTCSISSWIVSLCASASIAIHADQPLHTSNEILADSKLVDLGANSQWVFEAGGGRKTLPGSEVVRWGTWSGVLQGSAIWLSDGSWIAGRLEFTQVDQVTVHSEFFQTVQIPLRKIRGLVLVAPASIAAWNRLQSQLESTAGGRDTIWLNGNRQIAGVLRFDDNDSGAALRFSLENAGQSITVDSADIQAIAFSPTLVGPVPIQSKQRVLGMVDGSRLNWREMENDAARTKIVLVDGVVLRAIDSAPEFCRRINVFCDHPKNTTFLADLEPASYRHIAQSQLTWPLGKNRDLMGQPLMTSAGIVDRGLALHSSSQVAFRLDGSYTKFLAEVVLGKAADGADERLGSAACQVMLARGGKLQQATAFSLDRSQDQPQLISVDLAGAQLLVLVTDQADFAQYADHVLWLDARIAK